MPAFSAVIPVGRSVRASGGQSLTAVLGVAAAAGVEEKAAAMASKLSNGELRRETRFEIRHSTQTHRSV